MTIRGTRFAHTLGLALVVTLLLCVMPIASARENIIEKPNVVLILADDLGWTDLACFGSDFYETPHLDAFAAAGMKFTQNYSACTVCSPTRAALLTGIFTSDNGGRIAQKTTTNVPLRFGKASAYEGGVRVPMIVRCPGVTTPEYNPPPPNGGRP